MEAIVARRIASIMEAKEMLHVIQCMVEAGRKIHCPTETIATASMVFHRFFSVVNAEHYEPYIIAAASLYIASKAMEDNADITDIINVFYNILHRGSDPLEVEKLGQHWGLCTSVRKAELQVLKMLEFDVHFDLPHRYLMNYLKTVYDWLILPIRNEVPLAQTCWTLLADFYLSSACIRHDPRHVAIAVLYMTLWIYNIKLPGLESCRSLVWIQQMCENITQEQLWVIIESILSVYDIED